MTKNLLRCSVFILIILFAVTFTLTGCKGILSRIAQQEEPAEEKSISEEANQLDIGSKTKLKAFEYASIYVIEKKPSS